MPGGKLYESDFEETTIERLQKQGYQYIPASQLQIRTDLSQVVLWDRLEMFLRHRYPQLPTNAIQALTNLFTDPQGTTWQLRNQRFHEMMVKGVDFGYEVGGETKYIHAYPIDWDNVDSNDFVVVNQLDIVGKMARRPDILIYINGLPLVVFELKSPFKENATVEDAYTQITNYTYDITQLFNYNTFAVIADGAQTLHGMPGAPIDYFTAWKSIDGRTVDNNIANSMRTLVEGLFPKERLLEYIRDFIVFMDDGKQTIKIGAKYHQYFGVLFAVEQAIRATRPEGDRRIGVIWHTQGSGKSISMLFFSAILSRHPDLNNPTIVVQVDRNDLDEQLYKTFVAGFSLVGHVKRADSADDLRDLLKNEAGQIVFSTIEKFRLKDSEAEHPVLSERRNVIVIADEAHRTQYGNEQGGGFAVNLRRALPNASFIGFTGTPISFAGRDTEELFGNVIHTYDMLQAVEDKATVPIYYESRLIPLDVNNEDIDEDFKGIIAEADSGDELDQYKAKWAALEKVVGTKHRLETLAKDILRHFSEKASSKEKAMVVCMSRQICVDLYDELRKLPGCPYIEVIFTGDVSKDPKGWREVQPGSKYAHIKSNDEREEVKAKLKDPEDPLKMVIVRDMWLTGFDAPPVSILYVDKPMKGHNLMQAIARVNRVFPDKTGGIVVDYIGIATALKEATQRYTSGGGRGEPTYDIEQAVEVFYTYLQEVRAFLPGDIDTIGWRVLPKVDREDWLAERINELMGDKAEPFILAQKKLAKAHLLVRHLDEVIERANEILLYDILATQLKKLQGPGQGGRGSTTQGDLEKQITQLVHESVEANEPLDLFKVAGLERPDLSILDEAFLADLQEKKHVDLRLKLLQKLLEDRIVVIFRQNKAVSKSLLELLEKTIAEYHGNVIQAADVIRAMIEIKKKADEEVKKRSDLGLSEEEAAFYDIIQARGMEAFDNKFIADLVHKIVNAMKTKFQPDWTSPHRQEIFSSVQTAVKHVLMREKIKGDQLRFLTEAIVEQAKEQYKNWPLDA
ncbi:type I restriction endonuclease subunit R [Alicyclobacillus cycloheptanicus]|uniref:Type I restriction enzyme endonuclease subunit n=1 Tax=Alicyclobacillus cycloheptanicus TaxID=1457 RepID=A0ABT9XLS4_9BACL|nr:type I restriction endonuclease subunit R [Alicyclobacillus cycloheptanicus]MDQ0191264.1 type I restriction enzyme R subunit [Alicyclobacillus cycloheptanicus]WDM00459.1 type I restriction endonuclease subunit R [Alicyclobacillus cycloheptanicus]